MYIPKIKQVTGPKIAGFLKDKATGLKFNGSFVKDFRGKFFKGSQLTKDSEELEFVPDGSSISEDEFFKNIYRSPNSTDYGKGVFLRYFARDRRDGKVVELDKVNYLRILKEKKIYRKTLKLEWFITGNPEDEIINGYLYPGVKAKNKDVAEQAEKELPGVTSQHLSDYGQFVTQGKKRIQENLYTAGGEFIIKNTNTVYVGNYHIHPDKGPMVGAKHVSTPHQYLEKIKDSQTQETTEIEETPTPVLPTSTVRQVTSTRPSVSTSRGSGFSTSGGGGGY